MKKVISVSVLLMTLVAMAPTLAQPTTATWVMMQGNINQYGSESVAYGWCGAYAKVGEWAQAHAFWIPLTLSPPGEGLGMSFTYSFYAARLVNASLIELNYTEIIDLYISGIWDVNKFTFEYIDGNFTMTMEVIVNDAAGELSVTGNWTDFTIEITGVPSIGGTVMFYYITSAKPIPIGDVTGPMGQMDNCVDIWDLVHVARAYGSTPGIMNFNFSMDFDFDFEIGLGDLTTIAANLGEEY
ncbi:MAG: hypothetical protein QMD13_04535 [Candidatus Bathyarchaeia archaeon]|nr:hypothetical protein [Candidatus Bathyarchaeia archaeon]